MKYRDEDSFFFLFFNDQTWRYDRHKLKNYDLNTCPFENVSLRERETYISVWLTNEKISRMLCPLTYVPEQYTIHKISNRQFLTVIFFSVLLFCFSFALNEKKNKKLCWSRIEFQKGTRMREKQQQNPKRPAEKKIKNWQKYKKSYIVKSCQAISRVLSFCYYTDNDDYVHIEWKRMKAKQKKIGKGRHKITNEPRKKK